MNRNARLLELNPDFLTAWNYRKRAVQHLWAVGSDEAARKRIAQTELDLVCCLVYPKFMPSTIGLECIRADLRWYMYSWSTFDTRTCTHRVHLTVRGPL